jgi:NAD(P)-dependent dehydrogenase (short-subunit alcohol dehydrogenase family)
LEEIMNIADSCVFVTGGQRGIGRALVNEFVSRGAAKVYATARRPQPSEHPRVVSLPLDVTDASSVAAAAAQAPDTTIVVNNAGITDLSPLIHVDIDVARDIFETNVFGALRVAQQFAPILAKNGGGALIDIASIMAWAARGAAYGASKAALWSMTNNLRSELAEQHTLVVGVHLSYVDTDMSRALDREKLDVHTAAARIVDGIADGATEILVDEDTRRAKARLCGPVEGLAFQIVDGRIVYAKAT